MVHYGLVLKIIQKIYNDRHRLAEVETRSLARLHG